MEIIEKVKREPEIEHKKKVFMRESWKNMRLRRCVGYSGMVRTVIVGNDFD